MIALLKQLILRATLASWLLFLLLGTFQIRVHAQSCADHCPLVLDGCPLNACELCKDGTNCYYAGEVNGDLCFGTGDGGGTVDCIDSEN